MATENVEGYTINLEGNEAPWGGIEEAVIRRLIARLEDVRRTVEGLQTPDHNDLSNLNVDPYQHLTAVEKASIHEALTLASGDNPLELVGQVLGIKTGFGLNAIGNQINSTVAQIDSPSLAELQEMVDRGVTVFYAGAVPSLPGGTLVLNSTNYFFVSGGGSLYDFNMSDHLKLEFPVTPTSPCGVTFEHLIMTGPDAHLEVENNQTETVIRKLGITGADVEITSGNNSPNGVLIEVIGDSVYSINEGTADTEIMYQEKFSGTSVYDFNGVDVTTSRQSDWYRPTTPNVISAQITTPTLSELQALVDSGVTVFYAGGGSSFPVLPTGVLNLKDEAYYFRCPTGIYSFQYIGEVEFRFPTGGNFSTIVMDGISPSAPGAKLVFTNQATPPQIGKFYSRFSTSELVTSGGYIEILDLQDDVLVLDGNINYQYLEGTGRIENTGGLDITKEKQLDWLRPSDSPTTTPPITVTSNYSSPDNGVPIFVDTSSNAVTITLDDAVDSTVRIPILKISEIDTYDVTVVTSSGQLIGGKTSQLIGGESEGITVQSYTDRYEITQDSRDKTRNRLPGVLENIDHISKIDDNTISISSGSARIKKTDGTLHKVLWDATASQAVTIADGRLQWVIYKWNVGETDVVLDFLDTLPTDLYGYEEIALIGRIWKVASVLYVSGRHISLSDDPYISRNEGWLQSSANVSVSLGHSTLDTGLLYLSGGELSRFPVVEEVTRHHIFPHPEVVSVASAWEHMQEQTAFTVISDNGALNFTDITHFADYYDNGGTHAILPNSKFSAHLIGVYASSNEVVFFRGQHVYDNIDGAKVGIGSDTLNISTWANDRGQISKIGWVIAKKFTRDFSNEADAVFIPYSQSGSGASAGAVSKEFSFKFARVELTNYGGGDVDLPYVPIKESNVTQTLPEYFGVDSSAPSTITGVQWQNGQVAPTGGIEIYIKNDGVRSVIGTVLEGDRTGVFQTNIEVLQDKFVIFGFNAQGGSYPSPTITAFISTAGLT